MIYQKKENSFRIEEGEYVFTGTRLDPYGFWTVECKKGKTKVPMDGQYTSAEVAVKACHSKIHQLEVKA